MVDVARGGGVMCEYQKGSEGYIMRCEFCESSEGWRCCGVSMVD
jgi:hypothetical protein